MIKRESVILHGLLGLLEQDNDISEAVLSVMLDRQWSIGHARVFVAWAAGADAERDNYKGTSCRTTIGTEPPSSYSHVTIGLQLLLDRVVDIWTATDHIKHSLLAYHHCRYPLSLKCPKLVTMHHCQI